MSTRKRVLLNPLLRKGHVHAPSKSAQRKKQLDEIDDAVLDWMAMDDEELDHLSSDSQIHSSRSIDKNYKP